MEATGDLGKIKTNYFYICKILFAQCIALGKLLYKNIQANVSICEINLKRIIQTKGLVHFIKSSEMFYPVD